jgi:hypothetical protein
MEKELLDKKIEQNQNLINLVHSIYYNIDKIFVQKQHKKEEIVNYAAYKSYYSKSRVIPV